MPKSLYKSPFSKIAILFFLVITAWWIKLYVSSAEGTIENYLFNLSYIVFNLIGGISGLVIAKNKWGGFSSSIGKGLSFLSLGLLGQGFGLIVWTYYNIIAKIEIPYPSLADIGYFSLIPFYTLAMFNFAHASGAKFGLKTLSGKLSVFFIPISVLLLCYFFFLRDVGINLSDPLKTFLDIAYPAGEAIAVTLGLLTLSLSRNILGGKMKHKVELIIFALIFQFITEFLFLYTSGIGTYYNASFVDLMYGTSYFLMTLAILTFNSLEDA